MISKTYGILSLNEMGKCSQGETVGMKTFCAPVTWETELQDGDKAIHSIETTEHSIGVPGSTESSLE